MKAALRLMLVAVALGSPPRAVADTTDTILGQGFGQPPSPSYPRRPGVQEVSTPSCRDVL